ncbi:MAG: P-loop NTPase [Alphaproteobacteria bacterium]|nr:P-loop NTPase [Alphaproteobacteria bacterium]MBV9905732.1 P-loop NTPase [Alphaproteobacteria bacterium]
MTTHITAIGSGKGGTGKTVIAVSLAHALSHYGERVLLCDADLGLANAGVHLGLNDTGDLAGLMNGTRTLKDAVAHVGTGGRSSFDILAAPAGSGAFADATQAAVQKLIVSLVAAKHYDRVLIDLGAGVDSTVMHLAAHADETLLVLTPDPASLTDAYAFAKLLLRRTASRLPQVLVNQALNQMEGRRVADALIGSCKAFLKTVPEYLGYIPFDPRVTEAVRRQSPLLTSFPQTPAAAALDGIARKLHGAATASPALAGLR